MVRTLLVLLLLFVLVWLVQRLSRNLRSYVPGQDPEGDAPQEEQKIIDAEFEDVSREDSEDE